MSAIVILLIAIAVATYFLFRKDNGKKHLLELSERLKGPPTLPIFGNALPFFLNPKDRLNNLIRAQKEYGSVLKQWVGSSLYVFISDPADVEILLRDTKNIKKSATYNYLVSWLGQGLVTASGRHWHKHRKAVTPAFHFNILERFVDVFNEKGAVLLKLLNKEADKGDEFDIYPYLNLYAFDAILETSMGTQCNYQEDRNSSYVKAVHAMTKIAHRRAFNVFLHPTFIFNLSKQGKEQAASLQILHDYCNKVIAERRTQMADVGGEKEVDDVGIKRRRAFLDLLLIDQMNGSGFTDDDIRHEVNTFLFAGHDTITAAMGFAVYYLSRNQDVQKKAFEEANDLFGSKVDALTFNDLQNCQYMEMVIKETLRLSPAIPSYSRLLETDLQLTKDVLPAGCNVSVNTYMVHRNPEYHPDAERFDPERFTVENSRQRHPYAFVPFSAGPRNCIGQKYAMLELKATLVKIVSNYRILPGEEIDNLEITVVLKSTNGINVRLERRTKD